MSDKENINNGYYAIIPAAILYNNDLKPNEKLLYAIITSLACKEGYCFASNRYLAEKLGSKPNTVSGWVLSLKIGEDILQKSKDNNIIYNNKEYNIPIENRVTYSEDFLEGLYEN